MLQLRKNSRFSNGEIAEFILNEEFDNIDLSVYEIQILICYMGITVLLLLYPDDELRIRIMKNTTLINKPFRIIDKNNANRLIN